MQLPNSGVSASAPELGVLMTDEACGRQLSPIFAVLLPENRLAHFAVCEVAPLAHDSNSTQIKVQIIPP